MKTHPTVLPDTLEAASKYNFQRYYYQGIARYERDAVYERGIADIKTLASINPKSGYFFGLGVTAGGGINSRYTVGGAPGALSQTGVRGFCSNEDGVIRYTASAAAPVTTTAACAAYTALQ